MGVVDNTVRGVGRTVGRAAAMTTAAAGAVGGAAVDGVIGGVKGASAGVQRGISTGSHSTPAAALTLGALGIVGLVEWPVLVTVGAAALVLRQLSQNQDGAAPKPTSSKTTASKTTAPKATAPKATAPKAAQSANSKPRQQTRGRSASSRRSKAGQ